MIQASRSEVVNSMHHAIHCQKIYNNIKSTRNHNHSMVLFTLKKIVQISIHTKDNIVPTQKKLPQVKR